MEICFDTERCSVLVRAGLQPLSGSPVKMADTEVEVRACCLLAIIYRACFYDGRINSISSYVFTAGCLQVFLTNGRLQMYRNKEVVHSGEVGDGVCFVINGIVKVACIDLKDTQDYFLGSGEHPCLIRHQICITQHALVGR